MDKTTAMAINEVSKKVNDVHKRLDTFFQALHSANKADIDYLAMMSDVELDVTDEFTEDVNPEESTEA